MDKIKAQADKLWQLISNPSTGDAYKQTLALTWTILKETGLLLWLVICLVLVLGDWFWKYSFQAGQNTRNWVNELQTQSTTPTESSGDFWSQTGKSLLAAGQNSVNAALNTARGQLGIEAPPAPTPKAIAAAPVASTKPVTPPTEAMSETSAMIDNELLNEPKVPAVEPVSSDNPDVL
ncbi:MAG: hypothetical protein NW220_08300 [Leptolyngbyaceae cyanobacterium bins.349]|nr:hypothetical protein [Leptolyngbyaceae cyanobacterium bins.349]